MGLFSKLIKNDIANAMDKIEKENKRQAISSEKQQNKTKDFLIKKIGFLNSYNVGRDMLAISEYDFEEIKRASETDSYIKISLDKYKRMVYKAGYYLKSENPKAVEYLKTRFRVMTYATEKPMDILFQEMAEDLITYSNCILVKTRVKKVMTGVTAKNIFGLDPIGGYSRVDPSTIAVNRDECGNVLGYVQRTVNGKEKKYKPSDIIHIYMSKESSNAFGTPKIIAALEDVKLLRKLEGNILALVHRFAMPIFHWKIGKTQAGFQATDREIDDAKREIESMSLDGVVITNEKTDINVLGANSSISASEYLNYFESRVFSALDTSASQMGRGGAKQDSDSMEAQAHDYIKSVQRVLSIFIENFIMSELLLEGGFNPILNQKDIVEYVFNEISIETKIKLENHELLKYQSNFQSLDEARRNTGAKDKTDSNKLYKNLIEVPAQIEIIQATAKAQNDAAKELATLNAKNAEKLATKQAATTNNTDASKGGLGNLSNGKKPNQEPNKDAENRNRPTNQNGTTSVKVKESLDLQEKVVRNKKNHKKKYAEFYSKLERMRNNLVETESEIEYLMSITEESLKQDVKTLIKKSAMDGITRAIKDLEKLKIDTALVPAIGVNLSNLEESANETISEVFRDIADKIGDSRDANLIESVVKSLEYRFRFLIEYILPKAEWYAYAEIGKGMNIKSAKIDFGDSKDAENHKSVINLRSYNLDDIPAFHPFCDCKVKFLAER